MGQDLDDWIFGGQSAAPSDRWTEAAAAVRRRTRTAVFLLRAARRICQCPACRGVGTRQWKIRRFYWTFRSIFV